MMGGSDRGERGRVGACRDFGPAAFGVAVSRFGVMFFGDPVEAFADIGRALRPGGRLAFICAAEAEGNEWITAMAALRDHLPFGEFGTSGGPGMFSLADPDRIRTVLSAAGFVDVGVAGVEAYGDWGATPRTRRTSCWTAGPDAI